MTNSTTSILRQPVTHEWTTPQPLFDELDREFGFVLDAAASHENAKCVRYFTVDDDGLSQSWFPGWTWVNPPYGNEIGKWVRKAYEETGAGARVVMLIPARTGSAWWHDYVMTRAVEIRFIRGRLRFSGATVNAPFPSAVVVFRGAADRGPCVSQMERFA